MRSIDTFDPLPKFEAKPSIQSQIAEAAKTDAEYDELLKLARFEMNNHPLPDGSVQVDVPYYRFTFGFVRWL